MEKLTCPVCGNALKATSVDPNLYFCVKRKVWVSDLGIHMTIIDATINIRPEDGKVTWQVIEIPPYRFVLSDDEQGEKTVIQKYVAPEDSPWNKIRGQSVKREVILTVPSLLKLPWDNKEQVFEKVKLFLLFS